MVIISIIFDIKVKYNLREIEYILKIKFFFKFISLLWIIIKQQSNQLI